MGASAALAAGTACSSPHRGTIVPYTKKPVEVIPGVADYYASSCQEGPRVYPVLVKTREGRPIHIDGNDEHPVFRGKTAPRVLAEVLGLYDRDRLRGPKADGAGASWTDSERKVAAALKAAKEAGKPVLLMTGAVTSPTAGALIEELRAVLPSLQHVAWEPAVPEGEAAALTACYGTARKAMPRFDRARVILSLGDDFLSGDRPEEILAFAERRRVAKPGDPMNRLYVAEGPMTLTGSRADHRIPLKPSRTASLAFALARELASRYGVRLPQGVEESLLAPFHLGSLVKELGLDAKVVAALAGDLAAAGRESLVLCGEGLPSEAHVAVQLLNQMLGAEGHTADASLAADAPKLMGTAQAAETWKEAARGRFAAAIFMDVNPAYAWPSREEWKAAAAGIPLRVRIALHEDETARDCQVLLPKSHWLEAWGDHQTSAGLVVLQQPAVAPLYDTRQWEDVLLGWARALGASLPGDYHAYLKGRWEREEYPAGSPVPFERFWEACLHDGLFRKEVSLRPARLLNAAAVAAAAQAAAASASGMELVLHPGSAVYDGRSGNLGWLQELPDPVTKMTWGNVLCLSVKDASALGLEDGDEVAVKAAGASVKVPALVQPGMAAGVASLALGYGRETGSVAAGVGASAWPLLGRSASFVVSGAALSKTGGRVVLPQTQTHHRMEGRDLARKRTLSEYARKAGERQPGEKLASLYKDRTFGPNKWGMVIDLNACVGCSGCMIACQSENNIPVVGPEQVLRGREMHWIRVDRYYEGDPAEPKVVHQPMLCQQCDNAPCENVCPVNATNHSSDGLNQMAYNRCVGTRYCANNCPYKVRRFNFFEYNAFKKQPEILAFNPEVTVRPRGVMEKCTFCVQRIENARLQAKADGRTVRDGEITPACAAACPAQAIVFGDLLDPASEVSRLAASDRGYKVLEELGVKPAVTYLANLTNPAVEGGEHEG
jgi:Fe-S-cluster-containing dehydrogenase component/anaerobic selenocysteine-containing dehydrogenase